MDSPSLKRVRELTGELNYSNWTWDVEVYLNHLGAWYGIIVDDPVTPATATPATAPAAPAAADPTFAKRNATALYAINCTVCDAAKMLIRGIRDARTAWQILRKRYQCSNLRTRATLQRKLTSTFMAEGESMEAHVNKIKDIADTLAAIGRPQDDDYLAIVLLTSVSAEKYRTVIALLETLDDKGVPLTFEHAAEELIAEEQRLKTAAAVTAASNKQSVALVATGADNPPPGPCPRCKQPGHWSRKCPNPHLQQQQQQQRGARPNAHVTELVPPVPETTVSLALSASCHTPELFLSSRSFSPPSTLASTWIVDSGASFHYSPYLPWFSHYREIPPVGVRIGDSRIVQAVGKGHVTLQTLVDKRWINVTVRDVLFVPDLTHNLLSVPQITASGGSVSFNGNECVITRGATVLGQAIKNAHTNMYTFVTKPLHGDNAHANLAMSRYDRPSTADAKVWHRRLGHLHYDAMRKLLSKSRGMNMTGTMDGVCDGCALGKVHRAPMPDRGEFKATAPLQLVHSDVCGPMEVQSLGGASYFVTFTDHYSRHIVVYAIKKKDEAVSKFLQYKAWSENATGKKIKRFRSDGGGEYQSKAFDDLLAQHGIERQVSPAHTPEHNGLAERVNRTLVEAVRSTLHESRLPKALWAELLTASAYLRNRSPSHALEGETPHQRWRGEAPAIGHLRALGSLAYVYVDDSLRQKLDATSLTCALVGYEGKAYRFWSPAKHRVIVSRSALFDETRTLHSLNSAAAAAANHDNDEAADDDLPVPVPAPALSPPVAANEAGGANLEGDAERDAELPLPAPAAAAPAVDEAGHNHEHVGAAPAPAPAPAVAPVSLHAPEAEPRRSQRTRHQVLRLAEHPDYSQRLWNANIAAADIAEDEMDEPEPSAAETEELATEHAVAVEPRTHAEAMRRADRKQWESAFASEMQSLEDAGVYELVPPPPRCKPCGSRWVLKVKRTASGAVDKYKARLVAQGFTQRPGIDYDETFAPVAKFGSIRALLALAAVNDYEVHQMDVVTAYLNGDLQEELYMRQPEGFVVPGKEGYVWRLKKSLYGLKQAGRAWYTKIDATLMGMGFKRSEADHCIYSYQYNNTLIWAALYVDDLLIVANDTKQLELFKQQLSDRFKMKDLGEAKFILGVEIERDRAARTLTISQRAYVKDVLARFNMSGCNGVSTPKVTGLKLTKADAPQTDAEKLEMKAVPYQSAVGALMYAMLGTRPDIAYAITALSQFNSCYGRVHWEAVKRVMRYLKSTLDHGITYGGARASTTLSGYCDADWAANIDDRRSVTGYSFMIGGGAVSWQARKQPTVALSTVEAEYMATSLATQEAIWWRTFYRGLGLRSLVTAPTIIYSDSQGSIALALNAEYHQRTKHIDIRHHFIRERIKFGSIQLLYVNTADMLADVMTKALPREQHSALARALSLGPALSPSPIAPTAFQRSV
jgi:transposase InsO family protein